MGTKWRGGALRRRRIAGLSGGSGARKPARQFAGRLGAGVGSGRELAIEGCRRHRPAEEIALPLLATHAHQKIGGRPVFGDNGIAGFPAFFRSDLKLS